MCTGGSYGANWPIMLLIMLDDDHEKQKPKANSESNPVLLSYINE